MDKEVMRAFWFYVDSIKGAYKKGILTKEEVIQKLRKWEEYGVDKKLIDLVLEALDYYIKIVDSEGKG